MPDNSQPETSQLQMGFHFAVDFKINGNTSNDKTDADAKFQSVAGLSVDIETEEFEPVMIMEIYKAGSSTPVYGNPFNRDYIKVRGNKSLTEFGMRQHLNLGVDVRKIYKKLFRSIESVREVRVHSSSSRASVMSATSHNIGLFR